jgi:hypothetical protein
VQRQWLFTTVTPTAGISTVGIAWPQARAEQARRAGRRDAVAAQAEEVERRRVGRVKLPQLVGEVRCAHPPQRRFFHAHPPQRHARSANPAGSVG